MERVSLGFSLLLTADNTLRVFGIYLRISRLARVPQNNRRNRLIYDSTAPPPGGDCLLPPQNRHKFPDLPPTPPVNASDDTSSAPYSMQFGACLPCLLQNIWEADPENGLVLLSKWDISDGFHFFLLQPEDVGAFTYFVSPIPGDPAIYLCVDLVQPMGWVKSPPFFCAASKTAADMDNLYLANLETS